MKTEIKAVVLDIDGVLTDGTFWWDANNAESKRFSFRDVMGISRAARGGMLFALVSGEANGIVDRYAAKMGIAFVSQGCKDKAAAVRQFSSQHALDLEQVCFMGDDINDLEAMAIVGFSAAPADAHESALEAANLVTKNPGGRGAVRELLDHLFQ